MAAPAKSQPAYAKGPAVPAVIQRMIGLARVEWLATLNPATWADKATEALVFPDIAEADTEARRLSAALGGSVFPVVRGKPEPPPAPVRKDRGAFFFSEPKADWRVEKANCGVE